MREGNPPHGADRPQNTSGRELVVDARSLGRNHGQGATVLQSAVGHGLRRQKATGREMQGLSKRTIFQSG